VKIGRIYEAFCVKAFVPSVVTGVVNSPLHRFVRVKWSQAVSIVEEV